MLHRFENHRRKPITALLLCAVSIGLSGCGFQWPEWATINSDPLSFMASDPAPKAPPPLPQNSPLSLKKEYDPMVNTKPLEVSDSGVMGGSLGLNMDTYFDPNLRDTDARIDRLERALAAMHRDLKTLVTSMQQQKPATTAPAAYTPPAAPAVVTAPAVVNRVPTSAAAAPTPITAPATAPPPSATPTTPAAHTSTGYHAALPPMPGGKIPTTPPAPLYGQNSTTAANNNNPYQGVISAREDAAATPAAAQSNHLPPPAPEAVGTTANVDKGPRDVKNGDSAIVSGIRVGEHPDKVRIVFDVTKKTNYTVDLDNSENLLVVELPNARWKTPATTENFGKMPIVKSYKVDDFNDGAGNMFILQLKKPTQIVSQSKIPALSGAGERIVIDLKK